MDNKYYKETALEQWINELYIGINIMTPLDMDIHIIADKLNIDITYDKCRPFSHAGRRIVFLSNKSKDTEARLAFFHELCHILRHVGDQRNMPDLFMEGQEIEAEHFALYAAMPYFMIKSMELPERHDLAVKKIADEFKIPREFADKRVLQIERRIVQGIMDESIRRKKGPEEDPIIPESGVKLYSYYDYSDDVSGPSQLIVEVSEDIIESQSEMLLDTSGNFERLDDDDAVRYKYTPLTSSDIVYKNGKIGLNFAILKLKYGRVAKRLVLQMRDIEELVNF